MKMFLSLFSVFIFAAAPLQAQNVGIGTTTPAARLHIKTNLDAASILESSSPTGSWLYINNTSTGGKSWALVSTGQNNGEGAGNLLFRDNGSNSVRMMINPGTGNVGIGTTAPGARLHIATYSETVSILEGSSTTGSWLNIINTSPGGNSWSLVSTGYNNGEGAGNLILRDNGSNAVRMMINSGTGNVNVGTSLSVGTSLNVGTSLGIGTTTPPAKLTVLGTPSNPSIPNITSTGIFRIGVSSFEGIDFGKMGYPTFAGWIQSGWNGYNAEPLSLQPLGGNMGIGTVDPQTRLHVMGGTDAEYNIPTSGYIVSGNVYGANIVMDDNEIMARNNSSTSTLYLQNDGGSLETGGQAYKPGGGMWIASSDARLKKDIHSFSDGLEILKQVNPVWFSYNGKAGIKDTNAYVGIIAQEMQKIAPYMISEKPYTTENGTKENYLAYDGNALLYILVNGVKEQQAIIEQQKTKKEAQDKKINDLQKQIDELKKLMSAREGK